MDSVVGCESGALCYRDPGNHRVAEINRTAFPVSHCHQVARLPSSRSVKRGDSVTHFREKFLERFGQQGSPAARRQDLESKPDF